MGHKCSYTNRFEVYDGNKIARVVTAHYTHLRKRSKSSDSLLEDPYVTQSIDVYCELQENDNLKPSYLWSRHIFYSQLAGYLVYFPGDKKYSNDSYYHYYSNYECEEEEDWAPEGDYINIGLGEAMDKRDIKKLLNCYPDFAYVINKMDDDRITYDRVYAIFNRWLVNPEIESLVGLGMYKLALNANLYKLTKAKSKEVIQFITQQSGQILKYTSPARLALRDIQACLKYKISYEELMKFRDWQRHDFIRNSINYVTYKYLTTKDVDLREYNDYINMAQSNGHNIKEKYWKYPSNFEKAHEKVMEERKNIQLANSRLKSDLLHEVLKDIMPHNTKINGYDVFVTDDTEIIQKQCDDLYQCLIRNNYINKVIDQEEILVFLWKDGKPVATAEVFYNGKVGQFYGDERNYKIDHSECIATPEMKEVLDIWLKSFKLKKRKFTYKQPFYKGFHDKLAPGVFHTSFGDTTFKVGETYKTPFEDEEILTAGGDGCNATNKVFHFCDSVDEISRHYNPKYYCLIEPLGPVVEHDGALLSNKIKIIRELTPAELKRMSGIAC